MNPIMFTVHNIWPVRSESSPYITRGYRFSVKENS